MEMRQEVKINQNPIQENEKENPFESCNMYFLNYTGDAKMELTWKTEAEKKAVAKLFQSLIDDGHQVFEITKKRGLFKRKEVIGQELKEFDPKIKDILIKYNVNANVIEPEEESRGGVGQKYNPKTDEPKKDAVYLATPKLTAG